MRNNIPSGPGRNPAIREILLSDRMRSLMRIRAGVAQDLYQGIVAKRTGALAASARIETFIGGKLNDRWCGRLIVGEPIAYGAAHEFGTDNGDERIVAGARDLNQVLNMLAGS